MTRILSLGEALIDFVPQDSGVSLDKVSGFYKRFGGAPANVAVGLANLGADVGFMGKVGQDSFGDFVEEKFKAEGVNVDHLYRTAEANTTLAFVSLTSSGDRDFIFYRDPGADELLDPAEIDERYIGESDVLHYGSILLTNDRSRKATERAIEYAKDNGLVITMDPNVRLNLWDDTSRLKELGLEFLRKADIAKLSEEEVEFFTGESDLKLGTDEITRLGPELVAVTLGPDGCLLNYGGEYRRIDGHEVDVKDTTGAGDGFMAGFLYKLFVLSDGLAETDIEQVADALEFGNATGALTTTDYGATSAFPDPARVERFIADSKKA